MTARRVTPRRPGQRHHWAHALRAPATPAGKLLPVAVVLLALLAGGVVGFHLAFHSPWALGLYQTLVTVSTLGDPRVIPHTAAQYATLAVMTVLGYAAWALAVAVVAGTLVSIDIRTAWGVRSVNDRIAALRGHTIVVGGGRVGRQVATELRRAGHESVVLDRNAEVARRLAEEGFLALARDAMDEGVFAEVGIERAASVVLALPDDAQNLYALLAVRDVAPGVAVVARAESARAEQHLRALGVERVVLPTVLGGRRIANLVARPLSAAFVDDMVLEAGLEVAERPVHTGDPLAGTLVRDVRGLLGDRVTLLAIHRDGRMLSLPPADTRIATGDTLLLARTQHPAPDPGEARAQEKARA